MRGHHHDALAEKDRLVDIVRDEDHADAEFLPQAQQLVLQRGARDGVDRREGLVHQQDLGLVDQGAGHGNPLAHAAREFVRVAIRHLRQTDDIEEAPGLVPAFGLADATHLQAELDVLPHRHPGKQRILLEDDAALRAGRFDRPAAEAQAPLRGSEKPGDHVQQGALAAAGRPDDADELARSDGERGILESPGRLAIAGGEYLCD